MIPDQAPLVGREAELDRLATFLADREALPGALVIEGPAGAGKTTLWRAGVDRAVLLGYRVLACRPSGAEIRLANAALSDLLEPHLEDVLPALPAPQRRALEVALLLRSDDDRPPEARAIAAGFLSAVRGLTIGGPVLIAIDDAQWLDDATADVVEFAVRRLGRQPVAVLVSRRTASPTVPMDEAARGLRLEGTLDRPPTRVEVEPMSLGAIYRIVRTRTHLDLNRQTLQRIHETSGGNPFYALEIAGAIERIASSRGASEPVPLSTGLEQLLASRLRSLPRATREALFVASAVSEPTLRLVGATIGTTEEATAGILRDAEADDIVRVEDGAVGFLHPLFAAAAYASVDPLERRGWHARIADAARDPEIRARHLALARPGRDREVAHQLMAAARGARTRGAIGAATELLTEAIRRLPTDAPGAKIERSEWIVEASPVIAASGDGALSRELLGQAIVDLPPGLVRSDARLLLAGLAESEPGGGQRALELIKEALEDAAGDARRSAAALLVHEMWVRHHGRLEEALPIARQALAFAERADDPRLLAEANVRTADLEVLLGLAGEPVERFERALDLGGRVHVDAENSAPTMLGVCLIRAGRLVEARRLLVEQRGVAVAEGDEASHQQLCLFLAELEWLAGRWDDASASAREGLEVAEQAGLRLREGSTTALVALIEASRGDPDRARALAVRARSICDEIEDASYSRYARQVLAFLELSLGNTPAAVEHLETFLGGPEIEGPKRIAFIGDQVEALVLLGDLDRAAELSEDVTARGTLLNRPPLIATAARCRALVVAARGEFEAAIVAAGEAAARFEELGHPFELARALLVLGEVQRRAKRRRAARETLTAAIEAFDDLGAHLWSKRAEAERARIGGRSTIEGLSETEARVAALVAEGKSNKEVAAELFVSVRAVEASLSKIYAKLAIRSRTELARRV